MPNSPNDMMSAIIRNLPAKTGRSLDEWIVIARGSGIEKRKDLVSWLKQEHGLGGVQAEVVFLEATKPADFREPTAEELINAQYAGPKAAMRPIYERLSEHILKLGEDVRAEARQTYVAFTRNRQFALIQPSTRTRIDLGLVSKDAEESERLRPAGNFGSGRISHRVAISSLSEIDEEIARWLRAAYENA